MYPTLATADHEVGLAVQESRDEGTVPVDNPASVVATHLPQAVFMVDEKFRVVWVNHRASELFPSTTPLVGKHFYRDLFREVQLIRPDFYPLTLARDTGRPARSVMRLEGPRFF